MQLEVQHASLKQTLLVESHPLNEQTAGRTLTTLESSSSTSSCTGNAFFVSTFPTNKTAFTNMSVSGEPITTFVMFLILTP